jgi:hypothetical protein
MLHKSQLLASVSKLVTPHFLPLSFFIYIYVETTTAQDGHCLPTREHERALSDATIYTAVIGETLLPYHAQKDLKMRRLRRFLD